MSDQDQDFTITMRPTDTIVEIEGVQCRVWEGTTNQGTECFVMVRRLAVADDKDQSEFQRQLQAVAAPGRDPVPIEQVFPG